MRVARMLTASQVERRGGIDWPAIHRMKEARVQVVPESTVGQQRTGYDKNLSVRTKADTVYVKIDQHGGIKVFRHDARGQMIELEEGKR